MKNTIITLAILLTFQWVDAQSIQVSKGTVMVAQSEISLIGATV